jgi:hypothetical protein
VAKVFRFILVMSASVVLLFFSNCKKDAATVSNMSFSTDTLTFDTVFTTLGSTTQYFKVFNHSRQPLTINSIKLQQLQGTQYRINVDGISGTSFTNVQIPGRDSIYVFVEVTVNPNSAATPFVIIDNVNFTIGNTTETVFLQAFGQNAHFHYGEVIYSGHTETWNNDLPHVILGTNNIPGVLVECGGTLNIKPGCKVLFQANSALFVEGTLNAISHVWHDSIIFRGVRLEQYYQDLPGQWFGIAFLRSNTCIAQGNFNHCVINESQYGIYAGGSAISNNASDFQGTEQMPVVNIEKSIVSNSQYDAIYGFNANITAQNSLFYTSGDNLVKLGLGGIYNFTNCTMYNFGNAYVSHQNPILLLSNVVTVTDANNHNTYYPEPLTSNFTNCAIYGNLTNEITFSNFDNLDLTRFNNSFKYCLLTTPADTLGFFTTVNTKNICNQNPLFKNASANNFIPADSTNNSNPVSGFFSPLIDYCPTGLSTDLFDHPRPVSKTSNPFKYDIGAVEVQ